MKLPPKKKNKKKNTKHTNKQTNKNKTKKDSRGRVQTTWSQCFSRKHRIPSSARIQPLEMLQNYEDWQAESPTIILDIPGIQAKEHHTDEELRSLTLEALSIAYPSTTWARAYTDGSAERQKKMAVAEFSSSSLMADPSESLWLQGSSQKTCRAEAHALLAATQTLNWEERLPTNTVLLTDCRSILQSLQSPG